MRRFLKFVLRLKALISTGLIIGLANLIAYISLNVNVLDSLAYSIGDFDFTDIYFSKQKSQRSVNTKVDSTIVLVDISNMGRLQLALLLNKIKSIPQILK